MTDSPTPPPEDGGRPQSLGDMLRTARQRKGLELEDVAEVTHVRKEYLGALEEGRYGDLPEDVYARNFLRLYAQAVGLDGAKLLDLFGRERSGGRGMRPAADEPDAAPTSAEPRRAKASPRPPARDAAYAAEPAPRSEPAPASPRPAPRPSARPARSGRRRSSGIPGSRIGPMVATVLLVAAIVAAALWAFNNQLFDTGRDVAQPPAANDSGGIAVPPPGSADAPATTGGTPAATEQARDVLLTVDSEPQGAEVTVDGFPLPGTTPVRDVPVTARPSRLVRVTLDGYEPFEATYDLSFDRTLSVILQPEAAEPAPAPEPSSAPAEGPPPAAGAGQIALDVTETTWLEVYSGTERGQGTRLVYTTAQPGDRFVFDLPVYVHVGNASGLHVSLNGQERGSFGSPGAVTGRAFSR